MKAHNSVAGIQGTVAKTQLTGNYSIRVKAAK